MRKNVCAIFLFLQMLSTSTLAETVSKPEGNMCTCAGLIACEAAACLVELAGLGCILSGGRADAICMCKTGAMAHCTNWDDILNDHSCSQQKNDYEHNKCGDCCNDADTKERNQLYEKLKHIRSTEHASKLRN